MPESTAGPSLGSPSSTLAVLLDLDPQARHDAIIDLEGHAGVGRYAEHQLHQAADLWNHGQHASCLAILSSLQLQGVEFGVSISSQSPETVKLAADRGSVVGQGSYNATLVEAGNKLWVVAQYEADSVWWFAVYMSSDGGASWSRTFRSYSPSTMTCCTAAATDDHLYIVYAAPGSWQGSLRARRVHLSNGYGDLGYLWKEIYNTNDAGVEVTEAKLCVSDYNSTTQDQRLVCAFLQSNDVCKVYNSPDGISWSLGEDWALATHTLDATVARSGSYACVSYYSGFFDRIMVARTDFINGGLYLGYLPDLEGGSIRISSDDSMEKVVVVYERIDPTFGHLGISYSISHDHGNTWSNGTVIRPSQEIDYFVRPNVAFGPDGIAVVFKRAEMVKTPLGPGRFVTSSWHTTRALAQGSPWTTPEAIGVVSTSSDVESEVARLPARARWGTILFHGGDAFYADLPAIFVDGFESGTTGFWSTSVP